MAKKNEKNFMDLVGLALGSGSSTPKGHGDGFGHPKSRLGVVEATPMALGVNQ
jgi:hypothetical protein